RQEQAEAAEGNSIIGRALARVRPAKDAEPAPEAPTPEVMPEKETRARTPRRGLPGLRRPRKTEPEAEQAPAAAPTTSVAEETEAAPSGFLARHRRPLLLTAALVAVSMLALHLMLQRQAPAAGAATAEVAPETAIEQPAGLEDDTSVVPPRVIDLVDTTATGSINPGRPMSFTRAAITAPEKLAPPALAEPADIAPVAGNAESFELPDEAVGPPALREAAAHGNAQAQFEVAAIYGEGRALDKDLEESARWYERSAAQGFVPAQYRLGNLYETGSGVDKDLEQARLWYQRAAEAGNRMAMHNLAALHAGGELGEQQFELAAEWFEKAANQGMTDSQFNLGMLYARGLGVDQSFEHSYKWFSLAALSGDKDAIQARSDIAKSLTAEAVGRIDAEVEAWKLGPVDFAANFAPMGTWSSEFDPG